MLIKWMLSGCWKRLKTEGKLAMKELKKTWFKIRWMQKENRVRLINENKATRCYVNAEWMPEEKKKEGRLTM